MIMRLGRILRQRILLTYSLTALALCCIVVNVLPALQCASILMNRGQSGLVILASFKVLLNTILMMAQLELDGRAAAAGLGLEYRDFTHELQVMQV